MPDWYTVINIAIDWNWWSFRTRDFFFAFVGHVVSPSGTCWFRLFKSESASVFYFYLSFFIVFFVLSCWPFGSWGAYSSCHIDCIFWMDLREVLSQLVCFICLYGIHFASVLFVWWRLSLRVSTRYLSSHRDTHTYILHKHTHIWVCVCIHIYTHIWTYVHTPTHSHTYMYVCKIETNKIFFLLWKDIHPVTKAAAGIRSQVWSPAL